VLDHLRQATYENSLVLSK